MNFDVTSSYYRSTDGVPLTTANGSPLCCSALLLFAYLSCGLGVRFDHGANVGTDRGFLAVSDLSDVAQANIDDV